jgi:hypothetical protein
VLAMAAIRDRAVVARQRVASPPREGIGSVYLPRVCLHLHSLPEEELQFTRGMRAERLRLSRVRYA